MTSHARFRHHPTATYFVRVPGVLMIEAGIHPNDALIVNRSWATKHESTELAKATSVEEIETLLPIVPEAAFEQAA